MIIRSLRWRLLLAVVLILTAVIVAVGLFSSFTFKRELDQYLVTRRGIDRQEALRLLRAAGREGLLDAMRRIHSQSGERTIVMDEKRSALPIATYPPDLTRYRIRVLPGGLELTRDEGGRTESLQVLGRPYRIEGVGSVYLLPAAPSRSGPPQRLRVAVDRWLAGVLGAAILLAIVLMLTVFRRVFAPVEALTGGARSLASGHLDVRVPVRGDDEVAELGRAFNSMAEALERNERARRNMVSDVAHELRTPLTNIRVQIEAAQDGIIAADARFLTSMQAEAVTLSRLVDDLQQLSLAEAGQLRLELAEVTVSEIVERAIVGLELHRSVTLSCQVPTELAVRADGRRMVQVVRNLVVNALAYAESAIAITASPAGDGVEIRVADDGPGVAPEHAERIFDRFHRVDASRSRTTGGAGLGLAIARQLVEMHGGSIRYERPAFVVLLPRSSPTSF